MIERRLTIPTLISALVLWGALTGARVLAGDAPVSISSSVDKSRITIGDLITYTVSVVHDEDVTVEMPGLGANLGGFEIRDYETAEPRKKDDMIVTEVDYTISTFFTGEFEIPPLTITYYTEEDSTAYHLSSEPIHIVVESVKPSEAGDIRDIKPPVEIARNLWALIRWFVLGLGIAVVALAGYIIVRRKKLGKGLLPTKPEVKRPPHEVAYEALDRLKASDLLEKGEIKTFYIQVSEIIRQYIEGRYFIVAMEMTTTEVLEGLENADITPEEFGLFQTFLDRCDLVKFAKVIPTAQENEEIMTIATDIVDRTKVVFEDKEPVEVLPQPEASEEGIPTDVEKREAVAAPVTVQEEGEAIQPGTEVE